jgi:hypothetical protein
VAGARSLFNLLLSNSTFVIFPAGQRLAASWEIVAKRGCQLGKHNDEANLFDPWRISTGELLFHGKSILGRALRMVLRRSDATKTKMIRPRIDLAFAARADDVARAVLVVAEK